MNAEKKIVYAEDVLTAICMYCDSHIEFCDTCPIKDAIMDLPEAVIRCKDCAWRRKGNRCTYFDWHPDAKDFCSIAERKENEDGQDER